MAQIRRPCPISRLDDDGSPPPRPWYTAYLERREGEVFVEGTHLKASTVVSLFKAGFKYDEIRCVYSITAADIRACLCWWEDGEGGHV